MNKTRFSKLWSILVVLLLTACQPTSPTSVAATANPAIPQSTIPIGPSPSAPRRIVATVPLDWAPTLIAQGNGLLWIVGREDHVIARLHPRTNQLVNEPTILPEPIYDIVVGEGGVWVTGDTSVTRLDLASGKVIVTLRGDQFGDGDPFRLTVGDGSIWLLNLVQDQSGSHVHRIDPNSTQFVGEPATVGIEAVGITFGADSLWSADHDAKTVSRVNPRTNAVIDSIKLSFEPHYIYFNSDDGLVWVADYHHNKVARIDPRTNQLIGEPLRVPFAPEWMISGDGKVWVMPSPYAENNVLQNFNGLAEFDVASIGEASIISVDGRPMDAVISAGSLWVTTQNPNQILRLALE